jgi:hypothetical protein
MGGYGQETYGKDDYGAGTSTEHLPSHFNQRVLQALEGKYNHQNDRFLTAWIKAEGGLAKWNPLNSTLALGGTVNWTESPDYNSIGVRNYKYAIVGVVATVLTLSQRKSDGSLLYATLIADLKNGSYTAEQIVSRNSAEIKTWGTNPQTILDVLKSIP